MRFKFDRLTPAGLIRLAAESVLLFLLAWAPWPFASVEYAWESILIGGMALLVLLWFAHAYFGGVLTFRPDGFSLVLLLLAGLTLFQLCPLPVSIIGTLSPTRLQLDQQLIPATLETLPGETAGTVRESMIPLTCDPFATRVFFCQILSLLLLYTVVRSWLASRESLRRVAWVVAINGFFLALVGVAQFFSSPRNVVFWSVETSGAVFGPFVCKNHYPDYVLFSLGLGVGLLVSRRGPQSVKVKGVEYKVSALSRLTDSPDLIIMGVALILIMMSIPFTLSRGGLLAMGFATAVVAGLVYRARGSLTRGLALGSALGIAALLLGTWYGWGVVTERLETLKTGKAAEQRQELWSDVASLIPTFLATGGGNGAFVRFEQMARTEAHPEYWENDNAHNEYLEAILEGGLGRFLLTLALAYFALRFTAEAYWKLRERSSGPLILGIFFGLVSLIVHSFVDFGIHMPAVAFLATVLLAYAADAHTDPTYIPFKKNSLNDLPPDAGRFAIKGPARIIAALVISPLALWLLYDSSHRGRAEELKTAARDAARHGALNQFQFRIDVLSEAVRLTPSDGVAWTALAQSHFEFSADQKRQATMALTGPPAAYGLSPDVFYLPSGSHLYEGLAAARTARGCSPLLPRPHLLMATYGEGFTKSEPAKVHLERASRASPTDATIYALRGNDAMKNGDRVAAIAFWQKAMTLNPDTVARVLEQAQRSMSAEQILTQLLPPDPTVIFMAVNQLYPDWKPELGPLRKPYLERVVAQDGTKDWPARAWSYIAKSYSELGQDYSAGGAWAKAVAKNPDAIDLRDGFARWLEEDERYEEAEVQLLWLRERRESRDILDRLDAIHHAMKLKKAIESP